jgi:hypothetical protein
VQNGGYACAVAGTYFDPAFATERDGRRLAPGCVACADSVLKACRVLVSCTVPVSAIPVYAGPVRRAGARPRVRSRARRHPARLAQTRPLDAASGRGRLGPAYSSMQPGDGPVRQGRPRLGDGLANISTCRAVAAAPWSSCGQARSAAPEPPVMSAAARLTASSSAYPVEVGIAGGN